MPRRRKQKIKIKAIPPEIQDYDTGTREIHQREVVELYGMERKRRARVMSAPMDYYLVKDLIDKDQHNAGLQFLKLWQSGGGRPNYASMDLLRARGVTDGESQFSARDRYRAALESFKLPVRRQVVFHVVCAGEYADSAMRAAIRDVITKAKSPRLGMMHLRAGLDDLVVHFTRKKRPIDKTSIEK